MASRVHHLATTKLIANTQMTTQLETDYLIIGSGAVGMAFADVILAETDANIIIVDKHHKPGGHWNDAYPFVTLHQPSAFYGVSSKELSSGELCSSGPNEGLQELASGDEVMAYFDQVMRNTFLPSGRVQYFPMCEYHGDGEFSTILGEQNYQVTVNKKMVDGTYFKTSVPSTHTVQYQVANDIELIPLNELPKLKEDREEYIVLGAGKTGIDACIWLLENHIPADKITWIMPRDSWFFDRRNTQTSLDFFADSVGTQAAQLEALSKAESIDDLFDRLEACGALVRIDKGVKPKMFHGATISQREIEILRSIKNVVRMGRVTHINKNEIILEQGKINTPDKALHIDCTASAVPPSPMLPVFDGNTITIQTVRTVQPVFSAAFIAHIEASYPDKSDAHRAKKNQLCTVVPLPNHDTDWLRATAGQMFNQYLWSQEPGLREWVASNRLDGFSKLINSVDPSDQDKTQILAKFKEFAMPAMMKAQEFIAKLDSAQP